LNRPAGLPQRLHEHIVFMHVLTWKIFTCSPILTGHEKRRVLVTKRRTKETNIRNTSIPVLS
jgi:hypothetical protein